MCKFMFFVVFNILFYIVSDFTFMPPQTCRVVFFHLVRSVVRPDGCPVPTVAGMLSMRASPFLCQHSRAKWSNKQGG